MCFTLFLAQASLGFELMVCLHIPGYMSDYGSVEIVFNEVPCGTMVFRTLTRKMCLIKECVLCPFLHEWL